MDDGIPELYCEISDVTYGKLTLNFDERGVMLDQELLMSKLSQVIDVLIKHGYDINQQPDSFSLVSLSILAPLLIIKLLVSKGAILTSADLHSVIKEQDAELVLYVLQQGVDALDVNEKWATPLELMAECINKKLIPRQDEIIKVIQRL